MFSMILAAGCAPQAEHQSIDQGFLVVADIEARRAQFVQKELIAEGSYQKAQAMVDQYGSVTPELASALAGLADIPVDIDPVSPLEGLSHTNAQR